MTAKEILTSCRDAVLELRKLDDQLARCLPTGRPSGVKAQQYDAAPPGTNDPTSAAIQLYEGLMAQREEQALRVSRISKTAWELLRDVKDIRSLVILNNYYLLGMTDQEIANQQKISRSLVCDVRHRAFELL